MVHRWLFSITHSYQLQVKREKKHKKNNGALRATNDQDEQKSSGLTVFWLRSSVYDTTIMSFCNSLDRSHIAVSRNPLTSRFHVRTFRDRGRSSSSTWGSGSAAGWISLVDIVTTLKALIGCGVFTGCWLGGCGGGSIGRWLSGETLGRSLLTAIFGGWALLLATGVFPSVIPLSSLVSLQYCPVAIMVSDFKSSWNRTSCFFLRSAWRVRTSSSVLHPRSRLSRRGSSSLMRVFEADLQSAFETASLKLWTFLPLNLFLSPTHGEKNMQMSGIVIYLPIIILWTLDGQLYGERHFVSEWNKSGVFQMFVLYLVKYLEDTVSCIRITSVIAAVSFCSLIFLLRKLR